MNFFQVIFYSLIVFGTFLVFFALYILISGVRSNKKYKRKAQPVYLDRHINNPIISPIPHREWEAQGTFNPAAIKDETGSVHLFYRAIGQDGISRISHAFSDDGVVIDEQSAFAVYEPLPGCGMPEQLPVGLPAHYDIIAHPSGGGWGGSEDPRTVQIEDRIYMTYTAFEGWDNMRIGLTSISVDDLMNRRWNWKRARLISPAKARNKNWVLFPEKINGKFAILHSVAPKVLVAYVDSLDMVPVIESSADHGGYGSVDESRKTFWDKTMKGAGPPPLRTDIGWLLLYHAIHDNKYKLGAMILDIDDPTKILYRSPDPILSPDVYYENDGKPGVVYASGAIVKDQDLYVYYGGGDKHVCVAQTPLKPLLNWLMEKGRV